MLDRQDFDAVWSCMAELDGLTFYNGRRAAGASQRHKHLQFVPLPLGLRGPAVPIEPLLGHARFRGTWEEVPALGYKHTLAHLDAVGLRSREQAADTQGDADPSLRHFQDQISMRNPLTSRSGSGSGSLTALPA